MRQIKSSAKLIRLVFMGVIFLICVAGIALRRPAAVPQGFFATPSPSPTPSPTPVPPTPVPTPIPGAATVFINGERICTVDGEYIAQEIFKDLLYEIEQQLPFDETVIYSAFNAEITIEPAIVFEVPISESECRAMLERSIQQLGATIKTRKTETTSIPFETSETEDNRIPHGARLILQAGRTGITVATITKTYSNGELMGDPIVEESTLPPVNESIAIGMYISSNPSSSPGRTEGASGKERADFKLLAPVSASVSSNFGTREGKMHYGLDYSAKTGDEIKAPYGGTVSFLGERGAYGLVIEIDHGQGFVSRLSPIADVSVTFGQSIEAGARIGVLSAPVDEEVEPHLHYELLIDGIPYNPRYYMD